MPDPIVVSITTLPSRIGQIRPCLESLLAGDVTPDKIYLPLPGFSRREQCAYVIPGFLKDSDFCGSIIEVVPAEHDWGPGTKVMGALRKLSQDGYLVIADDDVRYRPGFLAGLLQAQRGDHRSSFSYHTYRTGGLVVGQGCDGFSFYAPNLAGIEDFYYKHIDGTDLFYHDDLWISFYLASIGIAVRRLPLFVKGELIFEHVHDTNPLRLLTGDLDRRNLNRRGVRRLLSETDLSWSARLRYKAVAIYDHLFTSPFRRMKRKALQARHAVGRAKPPM